MIQDMPAGSIPEEIDPYSQAVRHGNMLVVSGKIGLDLRTREVTTDDAKVQMHQCLVNIGTIAEATGTTISKLSSLRSCPIIFWALQKALGFMLLSTPLRTSRIQSERLFWTDLKLSRWL